MPDTPPAPVPVREHGYVNDEHDGFWASIATEPTPELVWPNSVQVFDRMPRQDAQVSSVLRAVISPIRRTPWRLDGTDCDPEVTAHVAQDLGVPIVGEGNKVPVTRTRGRFAWSNHLKEALLVLTYGHVPFEQNYRYDPTSGMYHLKKLGLRHPRTIAEIKVARDGGLVWIKQHGVGKPLRTNRLVVYVLDKEGGDWLGRSLLRPAYKNVLLKDRLLRVQTQSVERNGMGIPVYTGADGEESLAEGQKIATDVRSGDNAGAAVPNTAELKLMGVEGTLPDADKAIRYHDEQIARAVLAHFLNLGSQTGSWALGSTFADFFTLSLQAVAEEIRDTANQHIVEDLVDVNWGTSEPAPRLVFDEIGSRNESIVAAIASLVSAGVLKADEDLEQFIRTTLGLPPRSDTPITPEETA